MAWTKGIEVPKYGPDTEYLLFVCCTSCYDQRSQNIARSLVKLLDAAGVSYGIIGQEESCCGESIRKSGDEELFNKLATSNIELFAREGVKKIITTSPHCLKTFTSEYPELGGDYEVVHSSQLLAHLVSEGKLKLKGKDGRKVAFHDPCYLGRHSNVFSEPRELLDAAGAEVVPMAREEKFSLCCGGGGGRVWMETPRSSVSACFGCRKPPRPGPRCWPPPAPIASLCWRTAARPRVWKIPWRSWRSASFWPATWPERPSPEPTRLEKSMANPDFSNTAIVACGTLSPELKHLQAEGFLNAGKIVYTTPGLHQNCPELERQLTEAVKRVEDDYDKVIVIYGGKYCYVNAADPTRTMAKIIDELGPKVVRVQATHCMDMVASEAERDELAGGEKVWWMTPGWVKYRHKVFEGWDKGIANENFPATPAGPGSWTGWGCASSTSTSSPRRSWTTPTGWVSP